jgi:hypothetical protein
MMTFVRPMAALFAIASASFVASVKVGDKVRELVD